MRQQAFLRSRYRSLVGYTGQLCIFVGAIHLLPLLLIPFYPHEAALAGSFLLAGVPLITIGLVAWKRLAPPQNFTLTFQEGAVIIVSTWIVAVLAGTIPFITGNGMDFFNALFESTSGWTTTGLTVVDVRESPALILFFRSVIQLAGGAGFAIIVLGAGAGGGALWGLVAAEGRTDQLAPHVRESASIVLRIYGGYILFGILALRVAGMGWFDAVNHAFTALATGGFSTRFESIGYWDNAAIEAVICVLMVLGATNFLTMYTLLQRKFGAVRRNGEVRLAVLVMVSAAVLLAVVVTTRLYTPDKAVRVAVFETISALSGTGFTTVAHYHDWSDFGWLVLIVLMCIGGATGSTGGAIKQIRIYILYKSIEWEIRRAFMPRHMVNEPAIWQGEKRDMLQDRQVRQTALFFGMYLTVLLIGTGVLTTYGYSLKESLFEFATSLGNVGLTVGVTAPDLPTGILLAKLSGMLLGRLEIFAVIIGLIKLLSDTRIMFGPASKE